MFDNDSIEPHTIMPEVNYHRMVTHWTSDYTFTGLLATAKIFDDEEYIILEADTREHLAFDVNKFRKVNDAQEPYTQGENEIIFPMYKENIKEKLTYLNCKNSYLLNDKGGAIKHRNKGRRK